MSVPYYVPASALVARATHAVSASFAATDIRAAFSASIEDGRGIVLNVSVAAADSGRAAAHLLAAFGRSYGAVRIRLGVAGREADSGRDAQTESEDCST